MSGKKRRSKATSRDGVFSSLDDHTIRQKTLLAPLKNLGAPVSLSSWRDERLPELVWAALLTSGLSRESYLSIFREIGNKCNDLRIDIAGASISTVSKISSADFRLVFSGLAESEEATTALQPILLLNTMPGLSHWIEIIPPISDPDDAWLRLANAVAENSWHQSEQATDIRWLRVLTLLATQRVSIPANLAANLEHIVNFPNSGDMRSVRPMIRSLEMMVDFPVNDTPTTQWSKEFWAFGFSNTLCVPRTRKDAPSVVDVRATNQQINKTYLEAGTHFLNSIVTTDVDAKLDTVFGICLYSLNLSINAIRPFADTTINSRLIIRTLVELFITLKYLVSKNSPLLWQKYRAYGSGQAKLAFLKNLELDEADLPNYITIERLEELCNEDRWQEFIDIDLGSWASLDLRKMSIEIGVKEIYDKYYPWPSGYVHGHCAAVRDTVFDLCLNPLHRFHRIPSAPKIDMPSVAPDIIKLMNLILDLVNESYPPFKPRLRLIELKPEMKSGQ